MNAFCNAFGCIAFGVDFYGGTDAVEFFSARGFFESFADDSHLVSFDGGPMFRNVRRALIIFLIGASMIQNSESLAEERIETLTPASAGLLDTVARLWNSLARETLAPVESAPAGAASFLPLQLMIRGQDEISVDNVLRKLRDREESGDIRVDPSSGRWLLRNDEGRSAVPIDDPIQVIKGPQGYVIVDGHHDFFLALFTGAKTIAVHVREDLSTLSPVRFWTSLKERKLIYLTHTPEELADQPPKLESVRDNPNRYLAGLLALKVKLGSGLEAGTIRDVKGAEDPAWIKVDDSVPFIEFAIAAVLGEAGIRYDSQWGAAVPAEIIAAARVALQRAQVSGQHPLLSSIPVLTSADEAKKARNEPEFLETRLAADLREAKMRQCQVLFLR